MVLLIYCNKQHPTLHGTSHLLAYKSCLRNWREMREHVDILLEISHTKGNGARVYIYLAIVRPSYLLLIAYRYCPAAPSKAQVVRSFETP